MTRSTESERFSRLVEDEVWDEAAALFTYIHEMKPAPLPDSHQVRVNLLELSLNSDVDVPCEYFYLPIESTKLDVILTLLKLHVQSGNYLSDNRALKTLDMIVNGCTEWMAGEKKAAAKNLVIKKALEAGFPDDLFRREGRFDEIKRLVAEIGFDL